MPAAIELEDAARDTDDGLSKPGTKARRLQDILLAWHRAHVEAGTLPTDGRFAFYELEQQGLVSRSCMERWPGQDLSQQLAHLRELGLIPWEDIVDTTRRVSSWRSAPTVLEYTPGRCGTRPD